MKKIILFTLLTLFTIPLVSASLGTIKERNSIRSLTYQLDGEDLVFKVTNMGVTKELKRLELDVSGNLLTLAGDNDVYTFEFLKKMSSATRNSYEWCWEIPSNDMRRAALGVYIFGFGALGSVTLCAVTPAVPFLLGVLVSPFDGLISIGDRVFDVDAIAARKFNRMLKGKNPRVSTKVFNSLVSQISNL